MLMVKLIENNTKLIYKPENLSKLSAISAGYKELIERQIPADYSPDIYKIVYDNTIDGIIKMYVKINS